MIDVWVVSRTASRDAGTTVGVRRTLEQAKALAVAHWEATPRMLNDGPFGQWEEHRGPLFEHETWTARVSVLDDYQIERFELPD